ncbi:hypothetical protein CONPUDRAFT_168259 [Coniophora puteana RWD-64-598 SS2]|uniref:FHA domain-containing protein n=1 Tax=Coniophora puteana (strain RWD-64-598) TaxID=741705 RepID=A0A5M3MFA8_CONPW|nr:uncharacterized protein CONPUDRAFT_168259 [Coniophora puteana RWD-64-598 SS2]EIW77305.1 hypothetical protein CONPUDRAFT_168259 [Coniophora puteana RWD-64-598 SS2]
MSLNVPDSHAHLRPKKSASSLSSAFKLSANFGPRKVKSLLSFDTGANKNLSTVAAITLKPVQSSSAEFQIKVIVLELGNNLFLGKEGGPGRKCAMDNGFFPSFAWCQSGSRTVKPYHARLWVEDDPPEPRLYIQNLDDHYGTWIFRGVSSQDEKDFLPHGCETRDLPRKHTMISLAGVQLSTAEVKSGDIIQLGVQKKMPDLSWGSSTSYLPVCARVTLTIKRR